MRGIAGFAYGYTRMMDANVPSRLVSTEDNRFPLQYRGVGEADER